MRHNDNSDDGFVSDFDFYLKLVNENEQSNAGQPIAFGNIALDFEKFELRIYNDASRQTLDLKITLTKKEFFLMVALVKAHGLPVARNALLDATNASLDADERSLDAIVKKLRKKLGFYHAIIKSQRAAGYALCPTDLDEHSKTLRAKAGIRCGDFVLAGHMLTYKENSTNVSPNEARIIELLFKKAGRLVTHKEIYSQIESDHNKDSRPSLVSTNHLRQIFRRLEKLGADKKCIRTEYGAGYIFDARPADRGSKAQLG